MNKKALSTPWIVGGIVLLLVLFIGGWIIGGYNGFISASENVDNTFANVQTQYERRADLIPNLVNTVQGAVTFEQETQTQIADIRTKAAAAKSAVTAAKNPSELAAAASQVDEVAQSFGGLNINVENYPELKATTNFLSLQDELAGTENRIQVARERFNEAVRSYNVRIKRFPSNILAGWFGFEEREFFEAREDAQSAPVVDFN